MGKIEKDDTNLLNCLKIEHINKSFKEGNRAAFTMAEILISLTIIGIIAAITLPSLVGNIKEKAWAAQRKALYSRMTQAISMLPSLNGYGEYEGTWNNDVVTATKDTAAQAFVTNGLSKVLQIKNICTNTELAKCGLPDKYTDLNNSKVDFPKKLSEFQPYFVKQQTGYANYINPQKNVDTAAAAFETMNGESVAVFYNPYCVDRNVEFAQPQHEYWVDAKSIYPYFCAAFRFDLNGRKGPNKMGKDMWNIVVLYSSDSEVVMFQPEKLIPVKSSITCYNAVTYCSSKKARLANVNEGIAGFLSGMSFGWLSGDTGYSHRAFFIASSGSLIKFGKSASVSVRCIKR